MAKTAPKQNEINIDLLPKEDESKSSAGLIHWVLTIGRYLIIFTEVIALSTFVFGILLSKEKNDLRASINSQAKEISDQQTCDPKNPEAFCEARFIQVQNQLNTIAQIRSSQNPDNLVLTEFLKLLPVGISLQSLTLEKNNLNFSGKFTTPAGSNTPVEDELQTLIVNFNKSNTINNLDISTLTKENDNNNELKFEATAVVHPEKLIKTTSGGSQ